MGTKEGGQILLKAILDPLLSSPCSEPEAALEAFT
jgi:hypothetical protein